MAARKRSEHYVNNKEFLYAIVQYKKDVKDAEGSGSTKTSYHKLSWGMLFEDCNPPILQTKLC